MTSNVGGRFLMCWIAELTKVRLLKEENFHPCLQWVGSLHSGCRCSRKWVGVGGLACSVQRGVPAGAALTRTSLSIAADLRGRSAGLRRGSLHRRLTRPVTRGADAGLAGCGAAVMVVLWVGADMPRGQLQQGQRLHSDKSPQHPNEESRLAC